MSEQAGLARVKRSVPVPLLAEENVPSMFDVKFVPPMLLVMVFVVKVNPVPLRVIVTL